MKVGIIGAGGPAGANVARSLRDAGHVVVGMDANQYHFSTLPEPKAFQDHGVFERGFMPWLITVCEEYGIDLVHSQPDEGVEVLARWGENLPAKTFTPDVQTIALCQDKFETSWRWKHAELREFPVVKLELPEQIDEAIKEIGLPLWMRATRGAGGRGSTRVDNAETALSWWNYWRSRNVEWEWILEEYLPGRDYAWTSLWHNGDLVTSQARQRLQYIYPHLAPSGRTGTPTVAVTISDEQVNSAAVEAVFSIDREPHGLYCVDLREDVNGVPRPTEINAGRFFTTSYFYTAAGLNIPDLYVRLGCGLDLERTPVQFNPLPEGLFWIRHIDCPAMLCTEGKGRALDQVWVDDAAPLDPLWVEWYTDSRT